MQLDVGYGDAVTPGPEDAVYPTLLDDQPAPRLRVYPRASVVAEKLEAIVSLGMANSRMKDYFDLRALAREGRLDARQLGEAIAATFARRGTAVPKEMPLGLTEAFAHDPAKQRQWRAFLGRNRLQAPSLEQVVADVRKLVAVPFRRLKNFACVIPYRDKLLVMLKLDPDTVALEAGFSRDCRNIGTWGTGDLELTLRSRADLDRAVPLLERSYNEN